MSGMMRPAAAVVEDLAATFIPPACYTVSERNAPMKTSRFAVWILTLLISSGFALAQGEGGGRRRDPNAMDKVISPFTGEIVNIAGNTLSIRGVPTLERPPHDIANEGRQKDSKRTLHFTLRPDTKLLKDGKPARLSDFREHDTVQVSFTTKEGSALRRVVEIQAGKFIETAESKPADARKPEAEGKGKGKKPPKE